MKMIIYSKDRIAIGQIETASVTWHTCYNTVGKFQLYAVATPSNVEKLQVNNFVQRPDRDEIGLITKINIEATQDQKQFITVNGEFADTYVGYRIVMAQTNLSGTIEQNVDDLLRVNVTDARELFRRIPFFRRAPLSGKFLKKVTAQYTYDNILVILQEICKSNGIGFRSLFNKEDANIYFELYEGTDRSYRQSANPRIIFSDSNHNLATARYVHDITTERTYTLIGGEGEGTARKTQVIDTGVTLQNRKELFIDAKDISSNNGEIPLAEYNQLLLERGNEKLTAYMIQKVFEGDTVVTGGIRFNQDYFIGDIVSVQFNRWGITQNKRLLEMIEQEDQKGTKLIPVFGEIEEETR